MRRALATILVLGFVAFGSLTACQGPDPTSTYTTAEVASATLGSEYSAALLLAPIDAEQAEQAYREAVVASEALGVEVPQQYCGVDVAGCLLRYRDRVRDSLSTDLGTRETALFDLWMTSGLLFEAVLVEDWGQADVLIGQVGERAASVELPSELWAPLAAAVAQRVSWNEFVDELFAARGAMLAHVEDRAVRE